MKKKPLIARILIFSFFINIALPVFSEETTDTTPKPYDKKELPQGVKDLRRFDIDSSISNVIKNNYDFKVL